MSLEVGGVDDDPLGLWPLAGERREYSVEHAHARPADEAVEERLGRPILSGRVLPLPAMLDDIDDPTHHASVVYPRHAMGQGKTGRNPRHLRFAE
jgi:hypothetical protein